MCRLPELQTACEQTRAGRLSLKNMSGEWEWTSTFEIIVDQPATSDGAGYPMYYLLGKSDCKTRHPTLEAERKPFVGRCCQ